MKREAVSVEVLGAGTKIASFACCSFCQSLALFKERDQHCLCNFPTRIDQKLRLLKETSFVCSTKFVSSCHLYKQWNMDGFNKTASLIESRSIYEVVQWIDSVPILSAWRYFSVDTALKVAYCALPEVLSFSFTIKDQMFAFLHTRFVELPNVATAGRVFRVSMRRP